MGHGLETWCVLRGEGEGGRRGGRRRRRRRN
jgi:hypothetical protein